MIDLIKRLIFVSILGLFVACSSDTDDDGIDDWIDPDDGSEKATFISITLTAYSEIGSHDLGWFGDGAAADPRISFELRFYDSYQNHINTSNTTTMLSATDKSYWSGAVSYSVAIPPTASYVAVLANVMDYDDDLDGSQDISPMEYITLSNMVKGASDTGIKLQGAGAGSSVSFNVKFE